MSDILVGESPVHPGDVLLRFDVDTLSYEEVVVYNIIDGRIRVWEHGRTFPPDDFIQSRPVAELMAELQERMELLEDTRRQLAAVI